MKWSKNQKNRTAFAALGALVVGLGLSGCNAAENRADAQAPELTVPVGLYAPPIDTATTLAAADTSSTAAADTTPPTEAPATTAAPPVTLPPLPSNVEVVGPMDPPLVAVGSSSGPNTAAVQLRLLQLGFWNGGADGKYGKTTQQAVMAFQKYLGLPTSGKVDEATAAYMSNFVEKAHGQTNQGTLIEVDKGKQLLFIVVDGKTQWTLNTSTATGLPYSEEDKNTPGEIQTGVSITPSGLWKTNRERPEGWWEGDLGQIYRPKYFRGGVAVHGSNSIPDYPASHGCVRLSTQAMDWIWDNNLMPLGTVVWVHE